MKKRKIRKIRLICFIVLLVFTITFVHKHITTPKVSYTSYLEYTVSPNDTLWDIAGEHNFNHQDVRQVVYDIQKFNQINAKIYPGQVIMIPIDNVAMKIQNSSEYLVASQN